MSDSLFGLGSLVTDSGRTRFSGAGGGFPTQDIVEASLEPQRERIDRIETRVEDTQFENEALETLRSRVSDVRTAARQLADQASFDNTGNIFEGKVLGQASTSRFDSQTASDPQELIGVTLDNTAQLRDHQLEVLQTARAEQVASGTFQSSTDALSGLVGDGTFEGAFKIGTEQTVRTSDSVEDPAATLAASGLVNDDTSEFDLEVSNGAGTFTTATIDADNNSLEDVAAEIDGLDGSINATITDNNELEVESTNGPVTLNSVNETDDPSFLQNANIGRAEIQTADGDSLVDVRDKINNADRNVSASVVEVSDNDFRLQISSDNTGTENALELEDIDDGGSTNGPLADLGVLDGTGNKNVTQEAANARFTADNVKEQQVALSERVGDVNRNIVDEGLVEENTDFTFQASNDNVTVDFTVDSDADSLADIRDAINNDGDNDGTITASLTDTDGDGTNDSLQVESTAGNVSFDDGSSTFLENTNLDDEIFERQNNTVDDVFEGVTLDFRQAEDGTTIDLPVQRDLAGVKETVQNFVDAFNSARQFINAQRQETQLEGQSEDTVGVLTDQPVLDDVESQLSSAVTGVAQNVDTDFSVLREIGINFVDNDNVSDPTQFDTLEVEESELDNALSQNFESVRRLFGFNLRANDPDLTLLDFGSQTGAVSDFTLDVETDGDGDLTNNTELRDGDGNTVPIEINTDSNGDNTSTLEVTDGSAEGLVLSFNEANANRSINFDTSRGIGVDSFFTSQNITTSDETGVIESAVQTREDQNTDRNDRVETLETQLEQERERLLERFSGLEGTLAQLGQQQQILQARLGSG